MMKKIVFPDWGLFLHFSPLDEINLPQLFDCAEVELVLTLVVMEELIHLQWDHPVLELRQRAKEAIRQVEKWLEGQQAIGPGVSVRFLGRRPENETMERYGLNWQHQEELQLGTILDYKQAHADEVVIWLIGDDNLALQARSGEIEVATLSSEHNLTEVKNTLQTQKQNLPQELAEFRLRTATLLLSFAGGEDEASVTIAPQLSSLTAAMQTQLVAVGSDRWPETIQRQVEDVDEAALDDHATLAALLTQALPAGDRSFLGWVAEAEAERYRREVEAYPEKFERYLYRCLEMINEHRRSIRIDLEMANTGGAPAENVLLLLTLPEQLEWYWQPNASTVPAPPAPPTLPASESRILEKGFHIGGIASIPSHLLGGDTLFGEELAGAFPVISEAGTLLQWELGTYRHHQSRPLGSLYVRFRRAADISTFVITWEIREKNSSGSVRGRLLVAVETLMFAEGEQ